jgi:hypothetical protein
MLVFELASDLAAKSVHHWDDAGAYLAGTAEAQWFHVRVWAVGQAVWLGESARKLAGWAEAGEAAVDYTVFDCYRCHHALTSPADGGAETARQADKLLWLRRDLDGLPERLTWNGASWNLCAQLASILLRPAQSEQLLTDGRSLLRGLSLHQTDPKRVGEAAARMVVIADALAQKADETLFDAALTLKLLRAVAADGETTAVLGQRASRQAYRAVATLYACYANREPRPPSQERVQRQLDRVYAVVRDVGRFEPAAFAREMAALLAALPEKPE